MQRVKTGVVGVGALGRHHLRWLNEIDGSQLIGYYDTDDSKGAYAGKYGVTAFESLEELAAEVDAVSIVVPTTAHFAVASLLMQKGVHCLIEKPVTVTMDEALKLQDIADRNDVKVTVGHIERFNPAVVALDDINVKPSFIEAHRLAAFNPRGTDVAVIHDLMIHDIDLVLHFVDSDIANIQASAVAVVSDKPDIANARLTFENGAVANLTASRISLQAMRKLRVFQRSGYYSLDLAERRADLYRLAAKDEPGEGMRIPLGESGRDLLYSKAAPGDSDQLQAELQAFLDAVRGERSVAVPLAQGARALEVALEVERIGEESLARVLQSE